jgi:seryl-tRNA synthetase
MNAMVSQVNQDVLDPALFRDRFDAVEAALATRGTNLREQLDNLRQLEAERRRLLPEVENLKREQNAAGEELAKAKKQGHDTTAQQDANRARAQRIKQLDGELTALEQRRAEALLVVPNIPHESVPVGKSADDNVEVRGMATPPRRPSRRRRTGISVRRSASSISSAAPRFAGRALLGADRCRRPGWRGR